jgi:hypothetical protein
VLMSRSLKLGGILMLLWESACNKGMQNVGAWRMLAGSTRCLHMMWSLGMCTTFSSSKYLEVVKFTLMTIFVKVLSLLSSAYTMSNYI